jgi:hypothetical protein
MKKFILLSRGRTGSTSVINEIGKLNNVLTMQELFIRRGQFTDEIINSWYNIIPPYDYWLSHNYKKPWYRYITKISSLDNFKTAELYLKKAERIANDINTECFGWKVLSHHFDQRKYLYNLIKERGYKIIYLKRNIAKQVLSGMIANLRGKYNSLEAYYDNKQYDIDISLFKKLVSIENSCVESDLSKLNTNEDEFLTVTYEDYCDDKKAFYSAISEFMNHVFKIPPPSSTQIMIPNIQNTVRNFDCVTEAASNLGFRI